MLVAAAEEWEAPDMHAHGATMTAQIGVLAGILGALFPACHTDGTSNGQCQHPCDLDQNVVVQIKGSRGAASISVTSPCTGGIKCGPGGCFSANVTLANGSAGTSADGAPDLVCTVTAISIDGTMATGEVTASYTSAACCSGYQFVSTTLSLSFSPGDARASD